MHNKPKIFFMGTPDFAVPCLQRILDRGYPVVGVFTQPDKPKGRGYKLVAPPVKELALTYNIPVFQPVKLRDGTALAQIQSCGPDLIVVVAYGRLLPREILESAPLGCVNIHGSLLPKYRGAGPIQWSVINGEEKTGVTSMFMAEGLDTGDMILKLETPIGPEESYGELQDRLSLLGADCLEQTLELFEQGRVPREPQDDGQSSYAPMLDKELARLDFSKPAAQLHNLIRGLSPWPVAWTSLNGKRLKVHRARIAPDAAGGPDQAGLLLDDRRFVVGCGEGALELLEVQLEGAKRMDAGDFLRGRRLEKGQRLGE